MFNEHSYLQIHYKCISLFNKVIFSELSSVTKIGCYYLLIPAGEAPQITQDIMVYINDVRLFPACHILSRSDSPIQTGKI